MIHRMMNWSIIGITLFILVIGVSYLNFTTEQIYQNFPAISNVGNNDLILSTTYDFRTFGSYMISGVLDFFFNLSSWFKPTYDLAVSAFTTLPSVFEQISADIIKGIFSADFRFIWNCVGGLNCMSIDLIIIIVIVLIIVFILHKRNEKKIAKATCFAFTGSMGSGKTFMAVKTAIKHYHVVNLMWALHIIKHSKKDLKPILLSNIPICIGRRFVLFGKPIFSQKLTYRHLILLDKIPDYSTILIDELGGFASQYDYANPFVMQYISEFIRFSRHYFAPMIVITDQSSSDIVVDIRRRIACIYHLSNFRKKFFLFYKIDVAELVITEDIVNIKDTNIIDFPYFFGLLPLRLFGLFPKTYDSRCYSINYKATATENVPYMMYKTSYFISLPNTSEMKKEYQRLGWLNSDTMLKYLLEWENKK